MYAGRQWTEDGLVFGKWIGMNLNAAFQNFWFAYFNVQRTFERLDDLDTRGGPPIVRPASVFYNGGFGTDSRKRWTINFNFNGMQDSDGGWNFSAGPNVRLQPTTALQTSLSLNYTPALDTAQWIENADADGDGVEDHSYGRLRRDVINITARATLSFSRNMTLEAFLQPFVAVGDYTNIRKLARPSSFEFTPVAYAENPDFNRKSLRGTMVLRWEYVRGSTLFVVWNLATSDSSRPGEFSLFRDLGSAFRSSGTNVVAVKINYWLTP
jgi:hypothetical protein